MLSYDAKKQIVAKARKETVRFFPQFNDQDEVRGGCLYFTYFLLRELICHGINALPQAGTCNWPRMTPEQDDGVSPTHFGYVWSPDTLQSQASVAMGMLPEMHIWAGAPESQEIIDIQTLHLPAACQHLIGFDWPGVQPPDFLWVSQEEGLPFGVVYEVNEAATKLAWQHMLTQIAPIVKANKRPSATR